MEALEHEAIEIFDVQNNTTVTLHVDPETAKRAREDITFATTLYNNYQKTQSSDINSKENKNSMAQIWSIDETAALLHAYDKHKENLNHYKKKKFIWQNITTVTEHCKDRKDGRNKMEKYVAESTETDDKIKGECMSENLQNLTKTRAAENRKMHSLKKTYLQMKVDQYKKRDTLEEELMRAKIEVKKRKIAHEEKKLQLKERELAVEEQKLLVLQAYVNINKKI